MVDNKIDVENKNEFDAIAMLEDAIVEGFIGSLRDGEIDLDDEMLLSFMAVVFKNPNHINLIKAIGFAKFQDNRDVCLAINDFCAVLSDMREIGEIKLHE